MSSRDRIIAATSDDFALAQLSDLTCDSPWIMLFAQASSGTTGFGSCGPGVNAFFQRLLLPALRVVPSSLKCGPAEPEARNVWMQRSILIKATPGERDELCKELAARVSANRSNALRERFDRTPRDVPPSLIFDSVQSLPATYPSLTNRFETWFGGGLMYGDSALRPTAKPNDKLTLVRSLCAELEVAFTHAVQVKDLPMW